MMRQAVLGISCFGHDAATCIVDKETTGVIYAVAEERLTNVKHDSHFPIGGIRTCQEVAHSQQFEITDVALNFCPEEFLKTARQAIDSLVLDRSQADQLFAQILEAYEIGEYYDLDRPGSSRDRIEAAVTSLKLSADVTVQLLKMLNWYYNWAVKYRNIYHTVKDLFPGLKVHLVKHHLTHAATAFLNSGFDQATVLVIDGQAESDTVSVYRADATGIHSVIHSSWPNSLGIFYLFATEYLGFELGDEFKVMGMSAYGQPVYYDLLRQLLFVNDEGELILQETEYFSRQNMPDTGHFYLNFNQAFHKIIAPRSKQGEFRQEHFDFAASVQKVTEEIGVELARKAIARTGIDQLAIAGGVGLNGLMNERIRRESGCRDIFIYPAAGDDGTAVGAAQYIAFQANHRLGQRLRTCYQGYEADDTAIKAVLEQNQIRFSKPDSMPAAIARALADHKIVARYRSRAEFGPRALGNRSILANPQTPEMKDILNQRIKHREQFRPFAPVCLREKTQDYFDIDVEAPFMLLICQATAQGQQAVPAVVHQDNTARVQTIQADQNPDFYQIIQEFEALTGVPVVLNTSFNVNGETIVDTPLDALESFGFMDIDFLAIGDYWVSKQENQDRFPQLSSQGYLEIRRKRFRDRNLGWLADFDLGQFDPCFFQADRIEAGEFSVHPAPALTASFPQLVEQLKAGRNQEVLEQSTQPGDAKLLYPRAIALVRLNRIAEAITALNQLPSHPKAQTLLQELQALQTGTSLSPASTVQPNLSSGMMSVQSVPSPDGALLEHQPQVGFNLLNPTTLAQIATAPALWQELLAFHHVLATDEYVASLDEYYRTCIERFGPHWYYLDIVNVLFTASKLLQPRHYLEIGVRRGRSVCTVAHACPTVNIYAFDMWVTDYAGMENPGPEFVRTELQKHNHQGTITFIDGDSHQTLPQFFADHPDLELDLITVDGDHSEEGALADLCDVIPRLAVGGVLVFDDIAHPAHPYLLDVWRRALAKFPEMVGFEFVETGYGIGFAVRRSA